MSITRVSDFSESSFAFEDSVRNRFGSKKIGLVAEDGGPLLLKLENCLAYGINKNNKFGKDNYTIPLAVGEHIRNLYQLWKRWRRSVLRSSENPTPM
jgi:hypothetical protein